ncbi:MAG: hypothetical protein IT381_15625 [Deltaproteobacteria bacterium]|nr:hypothetical protein [Deltaproteobacteria bacterium]
MTDPQRARLRTLLAERRAARETELQKVAQGSATPAAMLDLRPIDAPGFLAFAVELLAENDVDNALAAAELATAADPKSYDAWMALGAARARSKQEAAALHAYAHAAGLRADDVRLWCDVGELKLSLLDYKGAAQALSRAIDLDPKAQTPAGKRAQALVAKAWAKAEKRG